MWRFIFHRQTSLIILVLIVDYLFYNLVNPRTAASGLIIIGFVLLLATIYLLAGVILRLLGIYVSRLNKTRRRLTGFVTAVIGVLIALQSIGQLSSRDALVIVPIAIVLYVYFTYARVKLRPRLSRTGA